jgi:hypothetical protein
MIEQLSGHKTLKVFMITKYLNRVGHTFQLRSLFLKCMNNSYQLLIIDFIIAFCQAMFLWEKGNWVEDSFIIILGEDASRDVIWSISFYNGFTVIVKVAKNQGGYEGMVKSCKGVGIGSILNECGVFSSEVS